MPKLQFAAPGASCRQSIALSSTTVSV